MPITAERMLSLVNSAEACLDAIKLILSETSILGEMLHTGQPPEAIAARLATLPLCMPGPDELRAIIKEGEHFSKSLQSLRAQRLRQDRYHRKQRMEKILRDEHDINLISGESKPLLERPAAEKSLEDIKAELKPRVEAWLADKKAKLERDAKAQANIMPLELRGQAGQAGQAEEQGLAPPPAISGPLPGEAEGEAETGGLF